MSFINIGDQLPTNGSLCWLLIPNKALILTEYDNDSFGLDQLDYEVAYWMEFTRQSNRAVLLDTLLSIEQDQDRIGAGFS